MVRLDLPEFESIVHNLLDNAVRYVTVGNPDGTAHTAGPGACVAVTLQHDGQRLEVAVQDSGPGIAPAAQDKVFERFYRGTHPDTQGSGLGLAIVRQAALRMGGQVRLGAGLHGRGVGLFVSIPLSLPPPSA